MAHSFVVSFHNKSELGKLRIFEGVDILARAEHYRKENGWEKTNYAELLSFLNYFSCNPGNFVALVDTYNTLNSGVKNFLICALVMDELKLKAKGIRLDSGDLAELSKKARKMFIDIGEKYKKPYFKDFSIFASNEIHEDSLYDLKK